MAGAHAYYSFCHNSFSINNNSTSNFTSVVSRAFSPTSTPALIINSIEKLCQQLAKIYAVNVKLLE